MPKIISRVALILVLLAMFPPLLVFRARAVRSDQPRIHLIQDMDNQPKFRAQHANDMFLDGRAMRPHVPGTVAREHEIGGVKTGGTLLDDHYHRGLVNGVWATDFPPQAPLSRELLERGRERFNIYCAPCHGESGNGLGPVAVRAAELQMIGQAAWVAPKAVFDPEVLPQPVGQLYNTVTHGVRTMAGYASQVPEQDRWAIVAWVKALQRSQVASWDDLSPAVREELRREREKAIRDEAEAAARRAEEAARRAAQQGTSPSGEGNN
ncbi:MAG: cytochrome c [Phycisphaeraceae bacterium]|nr:c-type cytochrome [Phycisphaerales bacterium]QOJ17923.1 MAG: cytochrome c [Phycisphaeraceae bacterium]